MKDLNRKMAGGAAWMVALRFCYRGIGIISTIILARLLVPADFGIVAMGMSLIAAFELMTAFGFDTVLIQRQAAGRAHYDTAWTFNVLFALFAGGLLAAFSSEFAAFYEEPRLQPVVWVLGLGFVIKGFENIAVVDFRKNLTFRKEFTLRVAQKFAGFLVTVPLAIYLRSYWALVVGMLVGNIISVVLSYWMVPYRARFTFAAAGDLFGFSKWLFLNKILFFLRKRSGDFILGKIGGAGALGVYSLSNEISQLAGTEITAPITRAVFPGYARISSDTVQLRKSYFDVITIVALITLPAGFGLASVAHLVVPILLGDSWLAAIPVIQILAISGSLRALGLNSGAVFNAQGRPKIVTLMAVINVSILLPAAVILSLQSGATGLAQAYLLSFCVMVPVTFALTLHAVEASWRMLVGVVWRPAVGTVIMYATIQLVSSPYEPGTAMLELVPRLAGLAMLGAMIYIATVAALWRLAGSPAGADVDAVRAVVAKCRRFLGRDERE